MHLCDQTSRLLVHAIIRKFRLREEERAGVFAIGVHREGSQRQQVDAIAILQGRQVAKTQAHADHIGHTGSVARRRTNPQQVVVAPLDVEVMVVAQDVHDQVRTRSSVVNIANDVQQVDGQPLDQVGERNDKIVSTSRGDDRTYDLIHIGRLIRLYRRLMQQLLDDIGKLLRQGFAHLGAGIFRGNVATDTHQLVQCHLIPIV